MQRSLPSPRTGQPFSAAWHPPPGTMLPTICKESSVKGTGLLNIAGQLTDT